MRQLALWEQVTLEHDIDRLEIEFGGHVAHRAIFVVKFLGLVGALAIAIDQMLEHLPMAHHVIAQVHRHEAGRSEEHTSELQSLMRISYAVFCLKKTTKYSSTNKTYTTFKVLIHII